MSRELRSCAVVGVEARRGAIELARVDAHQEGRREGLAQGFSRQRTLLGRLAVLRFGGEVADRVAGLLAGIADQEHLDAAALAQLDLVGRPVRAPMPYSPRMFSGRANPLLLLAFPDWEKFALQPRPRHLEIKDPVTAR